MYSNRTIKIERKSRKQIKEIIKQHNLTYIKTNNKQNYKFYIFV